MHGGCQVVINAARRDKLLYSKELWRFQLVGIRRMSGKGHTGDRKIYTVWMGVKLILGRNYQRNSLPLIAPIGAKIADIDGNYSMPRIELTHAN